MIQKFKLLKSAAILALFAPVVVTPAFAQESIGSAAAPEAPAPAAEAEGAVSPEDQFMKMFSKIFDTPDATPIAPAQLALSAKTAARLLPDGSFSKIMNNMVEKFVTPIIALAPDMSAFEIMTATGVYETNVETLAEDKRKAVTALLDPTRKERAGQAVKVFTPLINDFMAQFEPAMRDGLSRAYARKFTAAQLTELNRFFSTPVGAAYAAESYAIQADPEVMKATFKALPGMLEKMKTSGAAVEKGMKDLPKARAITDLNDSEMASLAELMGVTLESLKLGRDSVISGSAVDAAAEDVAEAAADAVAADPSDDETGEEPWYTDTNWTPSERKKITALDASRQKLEGPYNEAYDAWSVAQTDAIAAARDKYKAQGWKPSSEGAETASELE